MPVSFRENESQRGTLWFSKWRVMRKGVESGQWWYMITARLRLTKKILMNNLFSMKMNSILFSEQNKVRSILFPSRIAWKQSWSVPGRFKYWVRAHESLMSEVRRQKSVWNRQLEARRKWRIPSASDSSWGFRWVGKTDLPAPYRREQRKNRERPRRRWL